MNLYSRKTKEFVSIEMRYYNGQSYSPDLSDDFFEDAHSLTIYTKYGKAHMVENVHCYINQAIDWVNYQGDYYSPTDKIFDQACNLERCVEVLIKQC